MSNNNYTTEMNEIIDLVAKNLNLEYKVNGPCYKLIRQTTDNVLANLLNLSITTVWKFRIRGLSVKAYYTIVNNREKIVDMVVSELQSELSI